MRKENYNKIPMTLFLVRIFVFSIPFVVLFFSAEFALRQLPNSYKLKQNYIDHHAADIETLILGSSHTFYGLNPEYFESKAFNFSGVSQSPDLDFAILKSYDNRLANLKNIIIRLSYDTLFEQLKNSDEDWRLKDYKLYSNIHFDYKLKHHSEVLSTGLKQVLSVLYKHYIKDIPVLNCSTLGWGNDLVFKQKVHLESSGKKTALKHTAKSWMLLDENILIFENIMAWAARRNINVILVTTPAFSSYVDNLNANQRYKMESVAEALGYKYTPCEYFNFLEHQDFDHSDFYDSDHLNAKGAKKFSMLINTILEQ